MACTLKFCPLQVTVHHGVQVYSVAALAREMYLPLSCRVVSTCRSGRSSEAESWMSISCRKHLLASQV